MCAEGRGVTVPAMPPSPLRSLLLAGAALACAAPAAAADSIVYIDHGDVWSARPDGTGKVQLTDGGRWHSPTQADDGTIAAVDGNGPIVVMTRDGRVLRTIQTPPAKSGDGGTFAPRPVELSFSPDGSKIAYSYVAYSCPVASTCGTVQRSTFYTRADATPDATPIAQWGNQYSVSDPEWVTNDRALNFGGAGSHVNVDDLDSGADYSQKNWFNGPEDLGDGELSRDGTRLVTTWSYGSNLRVAFWAVSGDVRSGMPAPPKFACVTTTADVKFSDPSWSPDSSTIAVADSDGIETLTFSRVDASPELGGQGCAIAGPSKVIVPGGSEPDWGPADPPAARYLPPSDTNGAGASPGSAPAPTGPAGTPATTVLTVGGAAVQRFRRGTLTLRCAVSTGGRCTAVAAVKVGRRTYRSKPASATVTAGEAATLTVRFGSGATAAIHRALKRGKVGATVTLRAGAATTTKAVTLKR